MRGGDSLISNPAPGHVYKPLAGVREGCYCPWEKVYWRTCDVICPLRNEGRQQSVHGRQGREVRMGGSSLSGREMRVYFLIQSNQREVV